MTTVGDSLCSSKTVIPKTSQTIEFRPIYFPCMRAHKKDTPLCINTSNRYFYVRMYVKVAQWCPALHDSMDCSPPGSSVHGILQARILEWVAFPFSRGSSQPRDQTQVSRIAGDFFTIWATREDQEYCSR